MKPSPRTRFQPAAFRLLVAAAAFSASTAALAGLTDLATVPLQTSVASKVRPNLLYTLDDSGSMGWDYLPDYVDDSGSSGSSSPGHCRSGNPGNTPGLQACRAGDAPYHSGQFNGVYYNPQTTYRPPLQWDGTPYPAQTRAFTSDWKSVQTDPFTNPGNTFNIAQNTPDVVYCPQSGGGACKRNGTDTTNPFKFWQSTAPAGQVYPNDVAFPKTLGGGGNNNYNQRQNSTFGPFYYEIEPLEHCSDTNLTNCVLSTTPTGIYTNPAPVRFCRTQTQATSTAVVSDPVGTAVPQCISKYVSQSGITAWKFARYGQFRRVDLLTPSQSATWSTVSYGGRTGRTDCAAAPVCTADEELTNYANWYAYYRTRILMMKTATGAAFQPLDDRYRIGFITIHPGDPVSSSKFLPVKAFDNAQKKAFFDILYGQTVGSATPLREALSRAGRYFAYKRNGINNGINDDPMEYSCQQNFVLLTTDGYWNSGDPVNMNGNSMASTDVDNVNSGTGLTGPAYSARSNGVFDGNIGAVGSLADTALYYYKTDLRDASLSNCTSGSSGADVCKNNVPTSTRDPNPNQHMSVFTLGLVDGLMKYQSDYDTALTGDFARIKSGSTGCFWSAGTCNWPLPKSDSASALDDLWHAAVNGRGKYFFARDPNSLSDGLGNALSNVVSQTAAAAAAATSTPNVTQTDNFVFSTTYRTAKWDGEVIARQIDVITGNVLPGVVWQAQAQLNSATPASRTIYFRDGAALKPFTFTDLPASLQTYFQGQSSKLSQWTNLTAPQRTTVDNGPELINYLRGDKTNEATLFRIRDNTLGDTVNATPAYVAKPPYQFGDAVTPTYVDFQAVSRTPALYVGANDGMLHALNGTSGAEMWAYVPTMVMPKMHVLADENYAIKHTYFVDGSPTVMDAYFSGAWHTVLVAGLNGGGRGYYALDITNPGSPVPLWEFCDDAALCTWSDKDLGFTYGNPVVTKLPSGQWVVILTSGYNNTVTGDGQGYLYIRDLRTGAPVGTGKYGTGVGDTTTPSGLAKITALASNFAVDNTALAVYGGDLLGNVWKFDLTAATPAAIRLAQTAGPTQPITTRPEITRIGTEYVLYVATGAYLGVSDLANTATQTVYAFKDTNANLGNLRSNGGIVANTASLAGTTVTIGKTTTVDWTTQLGWRVDLPQAGERVNIDPQLIQGNLLIASNVPDTDACSAGGESFFYAFDYLNPRAAINSLNGTTLGTRIGSAVAVGLTVIKLPSGVVKAIVPLADTSIQSLPAPPPGAGGVARRIGWRQLRVQ
ncbi:MAG TPA: PilC/PilY family type IV pilus protein [Steroidobacteraceae bacterium]|nr:PilC/PilY family type IV pilus protein [Steroidobacteraceae bacterium]